MPDQPSTIPYRGETGEMTDKPRDEMRDWHGRDLMKGRKALLTGGDSGIGRAVSVAFAKEGADVAIANLSEDKDAEHTKNWSKPKGAPASCSAVT